MEITNMTLEQVNVRMGELAEIALDPEKRSALTIEEMDAMIAEKSELESRKAELEKEYRANLDEVEKRKKMLDDIATGKNDLPIVKKKEEFKMEENFNLKSVEYRTAYFKNLAGETLNDVEQRAFIQTTANFGGALPVETVNQIFSNIEEQHPILGDITLFRSGTILEVSLHNAIVAGDAAVVAQGVANADEENTWAKVTLSGKDFAKSIEISYALSKMNGQALEAYLVKEISERLGAALAADIVAQVIADTHADNKKTSAAVKVTTFVELNSLFALLKQAKGKVVYCNEFTLYSYLTSIVDTTGRPVFQPDMQGDIAGYLLGAPVKVEDAVADNNFLIGAPKKVHGNMVQDIMIESDRDIKRHVDVYSGYARFECKLTNAKSFVVFTMKLV